MQDLVIVDFETTGLNPFKHEVVEISVLRKSHEELIEDGFRADDIVTVRVMPQHPELAFEGDYPAANINGFSVEKWEKEQAEVPLYSWNQAMAVLTHKLTGAKWCGANAQFDFRFFEALNYRRGAAVPKLGDYHLVDLSTFGHLMMTLGWISRPSLDLMAAHFGIGRRMVKHHSSYEDVYLAGCLYRLFHQKLMNLSNG